MQGTETRLWRVPTNLVGRIAGASTASYTAVPRATFLAMHQAPYEALKISSLRLMRAAEVAVSWIGRGHQPALAHRRLVGSLDLACDDAESTPSFVNTTRSSPRLLRHTVEQER
ncbi:hypothetical protein IG631_22977 [Alternaria alternata]|nr:hypothetical protein IG631_22977 [Alternaria alternata]